MKDSDFSAAKSALDDVGKWFVETSEDADFDGGSLVFTYSGHGREGDGALCLNQDTYFTADDFIAACLDIRKACPSDGRLKLALILDSCYSGAFLLNVLEQVLHKYDDLFYPDYFFAASMPDEQAWEVSSIEHGLATYSRILQARIEMPEEEWAWPYHPVFGDRHRREMIVGTLGCSYATGGFQNPIIFDEHHIQILGDRVDVWTDYDFENGLRPRSAWEVDLFTRRDLFRESIAGLTRDRGFDGNFYDPIEVDVYNRSYAKNDSAAKAGFALTTFVCFKGCGQSVLSVMQNVRSSGLEIEDIEKIEQVGHGILDEVAKKDPDKGVIVRQLAYLRRFLEPLLSPASGSAGNSVPSWLTDAMYGKTEPCDPAIGCESCSATWKQG